MTHRLRRTLVPGLAASLLAAAGASATPAVHAPAAHLISHSREAVPFVADDYAGALSAARAKKVPIFVEVWAPW